MKLIPNEKFMEINFTNKKITGDLFDHQRRKKFQIVYHDA